MNQKPEVGRYPDYGTQGSGSQGRPGLRRGPPAGWRVATVASSLLLLSAVAGVASMLAGALFLLPLAVLAAPFLLHRRRQRAQPAARNRLFPMRFLRFNRA